MSKKGAALLMVFMFSIVLSGLVMAYLDMVGFFSKATTHKMNRYRTANIAEAGVNRIAWYLENTAPDSSTNGNWRGTVSENITITETGLSRTYNYTAAAGTLFLEGPVITATSSAGANVPGRAMDMDLTTYWRSVAAAGTRTLTFYLGNPLDYIANRDSSIYVSRTRLILGTGLLAQFPRDYTWQVSTDGATWTTVVTHAYNVSPLLNTANTLADVTDTFTLQRANYIRLNVTATQTVGNPVNIAEVEIFGVVVPATVSASSTQGANSAASAIDNSLTTYWQSISTGSLPQTFTLTFPSSSNYSVNKIQMRQGVAGQLPYKYTWTANGSTTIVDCSLGCNAGQSDFTDTFTLQSNVNSLVLSVTEVQGGIGVSQVSIGEIDVPAVNISANCSVTYPGTAPSGLPRAISYWTAQNVIVDGATPSVNRQSKAIFGVESGQ